MAQIIVLTIIVLKHILDMCLKKIAEVIFILYFVMSCILCPLNICLHLHAVLFFSTQPLKRKAKFVAGDIVFFFIFQRK